ncbi:ribonuclease domain-containing protein [Ornithinibacillus halotolerans]|uniref:Ribonuclease n=1 Tax=Ornithinibacillus halotolerans TaxID=1274357 RepID=A0A916WE86_9BACI|nr:ribonuclease domain-containing protein [Ornithinibacillus halotolerans]GGA91376.1 hypothetical protein GCM10008025_37360 [Ornithinibacillus halotolerans]
MKRLFNLFIILMMSIMLTACAGIDLLFDDEIESNQGAEEADSSSDLSEDGYYTSKEEVSLYIHTFGKLPRNYITKAEARELGWEASEGNLWEVTDQKSIGGDRFGNREGNLPDKEGRQYFEADINYEGGYRGAERIVYSNDGLIYYTADHYETFTLLYGDE